MYHQGNTSLIGEATAGTLIEQQQKGNTQCTHQQGSVPIIKGGKRSGQYTVYPSSREGRGQDSTRCTHQQGSVPINKGGKRSGQYTEYTSTGECTHQQGREEVRAAHSVPINRGVYRSTREGGGQGSTQCTHQQGSVPIIKGGKRSGQYTVYPSTGECTHHLGREEVRAAHSAHNTSVSCALL